jgi:hypothetical protein
VSPRCRLTCIPVTCSCSAQETPGSPSPEYFVVPYSHILAYLPQPPTLVITYMPLRCNGLHRAESQPLRNLIFSRPAHVKHSKIHHRCSALEDAIVPPTDTRATSSMRRAEEMSGAQEALRRPTRLPVLNAHRYPLTSLHAPFSLWLNSYFASTLTSHCLLLPISEHVPRGLYAQWNRC